VKSALFATILFFAATTARAQELTAPATPHVADPEAEPPPEMPPARVPCELCYPALPTGQTHDGFYLRLQVGGGYMTARRDNTTFSGDAFTLGVALGGMVVPNLALFGTVLWHEVRGPHSDQYGSSMTLDGSSVTTESFGGGLAYYVAPVNFYAALSVLATSMLAAEASGNQVWSGNRGWGFEILLGKEWWVGPKWGLGVTGEIAWASMTDAVDHQQTWSAKMYSVLFSATYN
jgi:hypothetical protein